jgi:hypothetical protein
MVLDERVAQRPVSAGAVLAEALAVGVVVDARAPSGIGATRA